MKKIWYLCNDDKKDKRVAKLLVYENNGKPKAQLDLMSFYDRPELSRVDLVFYVPHKMITGKLSFLPQASFIKQALRGKGFLPDDFAQHVPETVRDLQLRIIWGKKVYDSFSCQEELPPEAVDEHADNDADNNAHKEPDKSVDTAVSEKEVTDERKDDTASECFWLDDDARSEQSDRAQQPEADPQKENIRKIVELAVLEEEMIFRNFVHNSFLLHGYYNYGHLVIDEKDNRVRLGVPGNFYEREKAVALMFGFPNFEPAKDEVIINGTFGYYFTAYT